MTPDARDEHGQWADDGGPVPDRDPDTRAPSRMSDEILQANVVRLERHGKVWIAILGPGDGGLRAAGATPRQALESIAEWQEVCGWIWDETWRERRENP